MAALPVGSGDVVGISFSLPGVRESKCIQWFPPATKGGGGGFYCCRDGMGKGGLP